MPQQLKTHTRRNTVDLPFPTWSALRIASFKLGMTAQDILLLAITDWLKREGYSDPRAPLDASALSTSEAEAL